LGCAKSALGYAKLAWISYDYLELREISLGHLRSPWVVQNQLGITLGYAKLAWVSWAYLGLREISLGHLRSPWVVRNQLGITLGYAKSSIIKNR